MKKQIKTFADFWPFYVSQHMNAGNRQLHFFGTSFALLFVSDAAYRLIISDLTNFGKMFIASLFAGYFFAWVGHFFFEKNKPATFQYPLWSLAGDFKMYWLMWRRQMEDEVVIVESLQMLPAASYSDWGEIYPSFKKLRTDSRPLREGKGLTEDEKVELRKWQRELEARRHLRQMEGQRNSERTSDIFKR